MKKKLYISSVIVLLGALLYVVFLILQPKATKLYWFIPDGTRADPEKFNIFEWAKQGKLPNVRKMMEKGAYGYSIPVFPSHTPTNFATLFTGAYPAVHGIADGPMHIEGHPLEKPSLSGFASGARKVPAIWNLMDKIGKSVFLLSLPGSTPPEIDKSVVRGRWAPWGIDTYKIVFESNRKFAERKSVGRGFKQFYINNPLTKFVHLQEASNWKNMPKSYSPALEATLDGHGLDIDVLICDSTDDGQENYDYIMVFYDDLAEGIMLTQGQWTDWHDTKLKDKDTAFSSQVKIKLIKLWPNGDFRVAVLYNELNRQTTQPQLIAEEMVKNVGPMVDYADDWPHQLVFEKEDKETFLEEMDMSLEWHRKAAKYITTQYKPDVFIQDLYTPNLMLESRWWHKNIDPTHPDYKKDEEASAWKDIEKLYAGLDSILGELLNNADKDRIVVFSSDHGVCSLHRLVKLNNLFAKKGWLKFSINEETGEPVIDWPNTKVIYLKMAHVYLNPNGLAGDWKRSSGPEYEALRDEVIAAMKELADENGKKPLVNAVKWEEAPKFYNLPPERIGDIVVEAALNYFWYEEVDDSLEVFTDSPTSGYKQAIDARTNKCMWTPFMIVGPGVKKGVELKEPISHVDQLATILKLMKIEPPSHVQGKQIQEIFE